MTNSPELDALIAKSKACVDSLTPEQYRDMVRKQAEGWAKSEAAWPKPKFKMLNGVKVFESYEDYLND